MLFRIDGEPDSSVGVVASFASSSPAGRGSARGLALRQATASATARLEQIGAHLASVGRAPGEAGGDRGGFAVFGDGPVEIQEDRKRGGLAVGVASDELRRFGWVAVTAGVCEEILYRGLLMGALSAVIGIWPAVAVSSTRSTPHASSCG